MAGIGEKPELFCSGFGKIELRGNYFRPDVGRADKSVYKSAMSATVRHFSSLGKSFSC